MEALTALSVASSVIQFVDFGSKLLTRSRQLYKAPGGTLSEYVDVETLTSDLQTLLISLRRQLPENRSLKTPEDRCDYSEDDKALDTLCQRCVIIAEELLHRLAKLKVKHEETDAKDDENTKGPPPAPDLQTDTRHQRTPNLLTFDGSKRSERQKFMHFKKWESFRKALEASWNKKEIETLAKTLFDFRSEIEFRILISFR